MSRLNLPTLLMAFIGGLVALYDAQGLAASLAGLALLTALVAYDERGVRSSMQSLAFAFVCGLAALCTVSYPLHALLGDSGLAILPIFLAKEISAAVWLLATLVFWIMDRARMDARHSVSLDAARRMPATAAPVMPQTVHENRVFTPAPLIVSQPQPVSAVGYAEAPPRAARPETEYAPESTPVLSPSAEAAVPSPAAAPVEAPPRPTGKPASIYVNMVGEGMNLMRPVRAEHLGRDFYIIVDEMPPDERWEYAPGQVVRCRKKNLSHGKALVAYEEAPRAS